jgi:hypothetical protein
MPTLRLPYRFSSVALQYSCDRGLFEAACLETVREQGPVDKTKGCDIVSSSLGLPDFEQSDESWASSGSR